jgi:hypothetical protein
VVTEDNGDGVAMNETNNDNVNKNNEESGTMDVVNDDTVPGIDGGTSVRDDVGETINNIGNREDVQRNEAHKMTRSKRVHETMTGSRKPTTRRSSQAARKKKKIKK